MEYRRDNLATRRPVLDGRRGAALPAFAREWLGVQAAGSTRPVACGLGPSAHGGEVGRWWARVEIDQTKDVKVPRRHEVKPAPGRCAAGRRRIWRDGRWRWSAQLSSPRGRNHCRRSCHLRHEKVAAAHGFRSSFRMAEEERISRARWSRRRWRTGAQPIEAAYRPRTVRRGADSWRRATTWMS